MREKIALSPISERKFAIIIISGSNDIPKMAGMESRAKIISVIPTKIIAKNTGVKKSFPFTLFVKSSVFLSSIMGNIFLQIFIIGLFAKSLSDASLLNINEKTISDA